MDAALLEILACPICKAKLKFSDDKSELVCRFDKLAYPVEADIPVMLENRARRMTAEEIERL